MKNFIYITIIILLSVLLLNQCRITAHKEEVNKVNQNALLDSISYYKNSLGLEVAEKQTFKGTTKELKDLLNSEKEKSKQFAEASKKWRKLYNASRIELDFKIDSLTIVFNDPVNYTFTRNFEKQTADYFIKGFVNQYGFNFDFRSKIVITPFTGVKKLGLFGLENRTEITTSNPFVKVKDFSNFNFTTRKKRFGVGVFAGYSLHGPTIGVGVNYDLFRF